MSNDLTEWLDYVGEGWRPIIEQLYVSLTSLDPDVHIDQVKEKFGTLRFYYSPSRNDDGSFVVDDEVLHGMQARVGFAEALSARICERCGRPSAGPDAGGGYWLLTLCAECRAKHEAAR